MFRLMWQACNSMLVNKVDAISLPNLSECNAVINGTLAHAVFDMSSEGVCEPQLENIVASIQTAFRQTPTADVLCVAYICYKEGYCGVQKDAFLAAWLSTLISNMTTFCHLECEADSFFCVARMLNHLFICSNRVRPLFRLSDFSTCLRISFMLWCVMRLLVVCAFIHILVRLSHNWQKG